VVSYGLTQVLGDAKTQTTGEDPRPYVGQGSEICDNQKEILIFVFNEQ